jgi:hypothetical protein
MPPGNSSDSDGSPAPSALSSDAMGGIGVTVGNIVVSEGIVDYEIKKRSKTNGRIFNYDVTFNSRVECQD